MVVNGECSGHGKFYFSPIALAGEVWRINNSGDGLYKSIEIAHRWEKNLNFQK